MENLNVLRLRINPYFFSILGLLHFCSCYTVERDCINFHVGEFEFSSIVNGSLKTSYFKRTDKLEIETYEGKIDSASIRWVNDCECILTKLNPVSNQDMRPVQIKILSTTPDSYIFEYSMVGRSDNKQRGTIIKIN
tara:strand:- start:119 stop:526 length:408 start_codon:yes stop_codon:yes gene_type:complete